MQNNNEPITFEENNEKTLNEFIESQNRLRESYRCIRSLFKSYNKPIPDTLYVILKGSDDALESFKQAIEDFKSVMENNGENRFSSMIGATLFAVQCDTYNRIIVELFQIYKKQFDSELVSKFSTENIVDTLNEYKDKMENEDKMIEELNNKDDLNDIQE